MKKIGLSRKSIASSSTSIQQPQQQLDFQKIQDDIDHMALNKNLIKTDSTSSNIRQTSTSSNQVDSNDNLHKQESVSDIYFEYIKKKREEQVASKQKSKINDLIKDNNNKRHSINAIQVSFNPNGGSTSNTTNNNTPSGGVNHQVNVSNLMSNDSMSVDTWKPSNSQQPAAPAPRRLSDKEVLDGLAKTKAQISGAEETNDVPF